MGNKTKHDQDIQALFSTWLASRDANPLTGYLIANSNLPGPRGNLELAWAFGDVVGEMAQGDDQRLWNLCSELASIAPEQAPVNDPREFLPFCGVMGLSALTVRDPFKLEKSLALLKQLARDSRWRMREAVCMGLQRMMATRAEDVLRHLETWAADGDPLEMRAAAAAVADPPLLKDEIVKSAGLNLHRIIMGKLEQIQDRKSDAFRVLRQGLGYTLSVVVQAAPDEGLAFMAELAGLDDQDVRWILKENLKKNRLVKYFHEQVGYIQQLLG